MEECLAMVICDRDGGFNLVNTTKEEERKIWWVKMRIEIGGRRMPEERKKGTFSIQQEAELSEDRWDQKISDYWLWNHKEFREEFEENALTHCETFSILKYRVVYICLYKTMKYIHDLEGKWDHLRLLSIEWESLSMISCLLSMTSCQLGSNQSRTELNCFYFRKLPHDSVWFSSKPNQIALIEKNLQMITINT